MIAIIAVLSLVWYGIATQLYLMSIASFLFAWVYVLIENNSLPVTGVIIDEWWITVDSSKYDYSSIEKFALISIGWVPTYLRLKLRKKIGSTIDIPLVQDINSSEIKAFVSNYIEEDNNAALSNSDAIIHAMRL
jgi:hypothetical protein